jgi:hypothetical protein
MNGKIVSNECDGVFVSQRIPDEGLKMLFADRKDLTFAARAENHCQQPDSVRYQTR